MIMVMMAVVMMTMMMMVGMCRTMTTVTMIMSVWMSSTENLSVQMQSVIVRCSTSSMLSILSTQIH